MPKGMFTGCIHHPSVEAIVHCRQCATPVCGACMVPGPTGRFCSIECREKNEIFIKKAQDCDVVKKRGGGFSHGIVKLAGRVVVLLATAFALGVAGTVFEIPGLSDLTRTVRGMIGF